MMFTNVLVTMVKNCMVLFGVLVSMLAINYALTLMLLCFVPFVVVFTVIFRKFSRKAHRAVTDSRTELNTHILLVTGIASAAPLVEKLREHTGHITHMEYGDHHDFTATELKEISKTYAAINATKKLIITTEKDAARLRDLPLDEVVTSNLHILPIEVEFLQEQQESFNNYITDYVSKNSRNRSVH